MNTRTPLNFGSKALLSFVVSLSVVIITNFVFSQNTNGPAHIIPVVQMDAVPLVDAIRNLSRQIDLKYIIDPRVPGSKIGPGSRMREPSVTGRWISMSAEQVLADVLKSNKLVMVTSPATTVTRFAPANLGIKPVPASQVGDDTNGVLADVVIFDKPLDEAIKTIVEQGLHLTVTFDQQLIADPVADMKGRITFGYSDLTARQIIAALLDNYDLLMIEDAATSSARVTFKMSRQSDKTREIGKERKQP